MILWYGADDGSLEEAAIASVLVAQQALWGGN